MIFESVHAAPQANHLVLCYLQAALKLQAYASVNNGLVAELRMEGLGDKVSTCRSCTACWHDIQGTGSLHSYHALNTYDRWRFDMYLTVIGLIACMQADSKAELAAIESATAVMAAAHLALLPPNQPPLQPQQPAAQAGPSEVQPATGRPNSQAQQLRLSQPQLQQTVPQYQVHMPQQQLHPLQQPSLTPTATPTASVPATWPGPQAAVPPPSHTLTEPATHQPASDWNLPHFTATPQHAHRQAAQHEANARALEVPSTVRPQVQQQPQSQGKLLTSHPISQPGTSNRDGPHPLQQPRLSQSPSTRARHPGSSEHSC